MKTLPEILHKFAGCGYPHPNYMFCQWCELSLPEAQEAIAKELMGCLPEKIRANSAFVNVGDPIIQQFKQAEANRHNQTVDEVRARLTAFIGKEK